MSERIVVEVGRRGKLLVGEPYFAPGTPLVLDRKRLGDAHPGDLAVVRPGRGRARVERVVGPASSLAAVLEALLEQEGLRAPFEPYDPPEPPLEGRTDLRDLVTFTVDPDTAKDFDDAISARAEGGGIRVWVHIADVSAFVPAGTPARHRRLAPRQLRLRARPRRADAPAASSRTIAAACARTSTGSASPSRCCSTRSSTPGEPLFYRSVIRSDERLTYGRAQAILAGADRPDVRRASARRLRWQTGSRASFAAAASRAARSASSRRS